MSYYDAYSPGGEDDPWASAPEPMVRMKPTVIMGMICQVRVCIGCGRGPIEPGSNGCGECEWTMSEDTATEDIRYLLIEVINETVQHCVLGLSLKRRKLLVESIADAVLHEVIEGGHIQ